MWLATSEEHDQEVDMTILLPACSTIVHIVIPVGTNEKETAHLSLSATGLTQLLLHEVSTHGSRNLMWKILRNFSIFCYEEAA